MEASSSRAVRASSLDARFLRNAPERSHRRARDSPILRARRRASAARSASSRAFSRSKARRRVPLCDHSGDLRLAKLDHPFVACGRSLPVAWMPSSPVARVSLFAASKRSRAPRLRSWSRPRDQPPHASASPPAGTTGCVTRKVALKISSSARSPRIPGARPRYPPGSRFARSDLPRRRENRAGSTRCSSSRTESCAWRSPSDPDPAVRGARS